LLCISPQKVFVFGDLKVVKVELEFRFPCLLVVVNNLKHTRYNSGKKPIR